MIHVAAAVIYNEEGQILIARRGKHKQQGGFWEFPGGKMEQGEDAGACLRRELFEEMRIEIEPYELFGQNEHDYGTGPLRLIAYKARYLGGTILLTDHDEYRWENPKRLGDYPFAPADLPFVRKLALQ